MVSEKWHVLRGIIMAYLIAKSSLILVWGSLFDPVINYKRFLNLQVEIFFFLFWRKGRSFVGQKILSGNHYDLEFF